MEWWCLINSLLIVYIITCRTQKIVIRTNGTNVVKIDRHKFKSRKAPK